MIKKTILMLLVLVGGVMSANAFNDNIYFNSDANNWGSGDGNEHKFTYVSSTEFVTELTASELTYFKSNGIRFKFWVGDWSCNVGSVNTNDAVVSTTKYETKNGASDAGCLKINANSNAVKVQIRLKQNNDKFAVTACVFENNDTYIVSFDKSLNTTSSNWGNVYCYTYIGDHGLVSWTETKMSGSGNVLTCSIPANASHIIFNNGNNGNENQSWDITDIIDKGVYKFEGLYGVTAKLGAYGYTTFASSYALNLDGISNSFNAYYAATLPSTSSVKLTKAAGSIKAGEGLVLYGTTANSEVVIPIASSGNSISGNLLKGCTSETSITKNTSGYENIYVLVNTSTQAEFQNVKNWLDNSANTLTIPAGKAYLNATGVSAPSFSLEFDDETTGIANIERTIGDNQYYTLDGRRVAQPSKGLYIVNGKKVIIK